MMDKLPLARHQSLESSKVVCGERPGSKRVSGVYGHGVSKRSGVGGRLGAES